MGWKDWPNAVKGGVISVLVWAIITLVLIPFGSSQDFFKFPYWSYPSIIPITIVNLISHNIYKTLVQSQILLVSIAFFFYFIFGALIGLIYGKIKQRK